MEGSMSEFVMDTLMSNYDKKNDKTWRKRELEYLAQQRQWWLDDRTRDFEWRRQDIRLQRLQAKLENEQRQANTRSDHLSAISEIAAELSGFALVSIININLPKDINIDLLCVYGIVSAVTICCMILSLIICNILNLAITDFCTMRLERDVKMLQDDEFDTVHPFQEWWKRCEDDWQLSYQLFRAGVTLFLVELAVVSWVQYCHYRLTSISITFVAFVGLLIWNTRIWSKWRYLMAPPVVEVPSKINPPRNSASTASASASRATESSSFRSFRESTRSEPTEKSSLRQWSHSSRSYGAVEAVLAKAKANKS